MNRAVYLFLCLAVFSLTAVSQVPSSQPRTPEAQFQLGNQYFSQNDYSAAMTWYRKAADQGSAAAQAKIGWLYENGFGVKQDYTEALNWYRKAAEQSNAAAQNNLGWLYQNGFGVKQDYAEAANYYRKAADQGNVKAAVNLGWLYENGWGVERDCSRALQSYLAAANKGDAGAQTNVGVLYEKGLGVEKDYQVAMAWYYRAADQGNALAQTNLGLLYRNGLGVPQDYGKAAEWFRKAADGGNARAQVSLAWLYTNGLGVGLDYAEAMAWCRKAADQGYADGQSGIGWLYENGFGVKKDYAEAMNWYRKAAAQNEADAENHIGWFYQNGLGVKQDYAEAMSWYQKAAAQGHARAKANIELLSKIESQSAPGMSQKDRTPSTSEKSGAIFMAGGIKAPRAIYSPDPEYSEEARKKAISGTTLLSLIVGSDGQPRDIKVVAPLGNGLDAKAVEAVKTWKFEPATKDRKPVTVQIMVEVSFRLYEHASIGKVEIVSDTQGESFDPYVSPLILEASDCWRKSTEDKAQAPSAKEGQVTVQAAIEPDGKVGRAEILSPSGDGVLDKDARDCVTSLKANPWPMEKGKELGVRMQFLYNTNSIALNPAHPQVDAGGKEQFYVDLAGTLNTGTNWSVSGVGCSGDACGTMTSGGVYRAPDVVPQPPFVVVSGTLPGANPITASSIVTLTSKPATSSAKSQ